MDLVSYWTAQIARWNEEEKCGLCWAFSAPLTESAAQVQEIREAEKCCVQVMLLRDKGQAFSTTVNYNPNTGLLQNQTCNTSFQLVVVIASDVGTNNYNEAQGHPTDESKWNTILSKLETCLACDANLDFCEFIGSAYRLNIWRGDQLINWRNGYSGYRITANFQNLS